MSLTIATFSPEEIVTGTQAVTDSINSACRERDIPKTIQAVCQVADAVHFILRHCDQFDRREYYIVQLEDTTQAGFAAAVNARFQGSTDIVGTFFAHGTTYAVFQDAQQP